MSVINYTSLHEIPVFSGPNNLTQFERTQFCMTQPYGSDQCGAFAFVAAAATFGKLPASKTIGINFGAENNKRVQREATLNKTDNFAELASKIYVVTGIMSHDGTVAEHDGYNSPAALLSVAMQFGLKVELFVTEKAKEDFTALSKQEYHWCELELKKENKTIQTDHGDIVIGANQIALTLMTTFNGTYHWIARSSDNTYFDSLRNFYPGNQFGRVGGSWSSRPYTDSGVTILLTK